MPGVKQSKQGDVLKKQTDKADRHCAKEKEPGAEGMLSS